MLMLIQQTQEQQEMRALSNKLQKQSEDLDRKLASDDSTSLALVVRNMNTKQTKSNR